MATPAQRPHTDETPHLLPNGVTAHLLTTEERRRGADATNEKRRLEREAIQREAQEQAIDELRQHLLGAAEKLGEQLSSDDERVAQAAARDILDRFLGKATQTISGPDGGPLEVETTHVRDGAQRFLDSVDVEAATVPLAALGAAAGAAEPADRD